MAQTCIPSIDSVNCHEVTSLVSCTLDDLLQRVPAYSWAQVFAAVDRLSRKATLMLSRTSRFGYVLLSVRSSRPQCSKHIRSWRCVGGTAGSTLVVRAVPPSIARVDLNMLFLFQRRIQTISVAIW
jgi:hypothetical protein